LRKNEVSIYGRAGSQGELEEGMKALFKVPKEKVAKAAKKNNSRPSQTKKPKRADEN
jgi:hypothetical protein